MAEKVRVIGSDDGLRFAFELGNGLSPGLAWGAGQVWLRGETVWASEDQYGNEAKVDWTWVDLLEFLARKWPWLVLEESFPIPVTPLYPGLLRREAERRWENLADDQIEREDEAVYRFLCRHDLAMGIKGLYLPSLIVLRQGRDCMISSASPSLNVIRPFDEVRGTLTELGEFLADYVGGSEEPRALAARELWCSRERRLQSMVVVLRSGLGEASLEQLTQGQSAEQFWELDADAPDTDTEMLAAARMTAGVSGLDVQREILSRLREFGWRDTPVLDRLGDTIEAGFKEVGRPYEQAYWLAGSLRHELSIDEFAPVDPEELLKRWGVALADVELPACALEAIAAWGPRHGPVVLLNTAPNSRASRPYGRRSTLAHEICHLLVDRRRSLPVAEVLGGLTPEYVEKRARAFAAELLLPRETAAARVREAADLRLAIEQLQQEYQVSNELIKWQISNSSAFESLSVTEQSILYQVDRSGD